MSETYKYFTVTGPTRAQFTVEGSRFIGSLAPAATEARAQKFIDSLKAAFADATHNTYAYRIGTGPALIERAADDREPAGTAGLPMLQVLQGAGVSDSVVVGTRYFGGVKLGIGGLTRAYRQCARGCLEQASLSEKEQLSRYLLTTAYSELGPLSRHIESLGGEIIKVNYTDMAMVTAMVPTRLSDELLTGFRELSRGRGKWELEKQ
jgi:uncharacterized YigZ family protein